MDEEKESIEKRLRGVYENTRKDGKGARRFNLSGKKKTYLSKKYKNKKFKKSEIKKAIL